MVQDVQLRIASLPPPRGAPSYKLTLSNLPTAPDVALSQLVAVRNLINQCLDVVDVSTWTGDSHDANFISGQLRLLHDNLSEARQTLKGTELHSLWWAESVPEAAFDPPLPANVSFHLCIIEAALVLHLRTLQSADPNAPAPDSLTGFSLRDRLAVALGGPKPPAHDEVGEVFMFRGEQVKVREKIRVESQDPSLMAVMAKLSALEHGVAASRNNLSIVMGEED